MDSDEIILIISTGTFVLGMFCLAIILFVMLYMKRRKLHQAELEATVLKTELSTIEKTSSQISRELHDHIAQHLSVACIMLQEPELKGEALKNTYKLVDDSIEELRRVSRMLTAHHIQEISLSEALKQEIALYQGRLQSELIFETKGEGQHLNHQQELMMLRIAQEALSNAIKHSAATKIIVALESNADSSTLSISDNGKGFDINKPLAANGLHNMQQRAALIHAQLEIISAAGKGTEIRVISKT